MQTFKKASLLVGLLMLSALISFSAVKAEDQATNESQLEAQKQAQEKAREDAKNQLEVQKQEQERIREDAKNQVETQKQEEDNDSVDGEQHKSKVEKVTKELEDVADKTPEDVSTKVKEVAKEQEDAKDKVAKSIDAIKNRSAVKTFLIGTDYKNIGQLRSEMVKTDNQVKQLENVVTKITDPTDKTAIQDQIKVIQAQQQKINDFLKANEDKFSLLGWLVKFFNK
jgi:hypothetical protein